MHLPKIIVIVGPTASGKSSMAIALAKKFNGEVISADSRQVYRGLDIASGKVTEKEMDGIPHHLLNVADPSKQFSVADFNRLGTEAIEEILKNKKLPIVAGGTGFYIQALVDGLHLPEVAPNEELRNTLSKKPVDELVALLHERDPERVATIDTKNKIRLIRAIEIAEALGTVPSIKKESKYETLFICIDLPDEELRRNIHKRTIARADGGMFEEVESLLKAGLSSERLKELGLEYRILAKYCKGELSQKEALVAIEKEDWHYAKRQRTWFKRDARIEWFTPGELDRISTRVSDFLQSTHSSE